MLKFLALFLLFHISFLIAQTTSIEQHNNRLQKQGTITIDNIDQLMIQAYLFRETKYDFSQIADGYDDMLADLSYGVVFALDQPDSINWYLCPIDFQTATNEVAFQYFYYCGDTLALENVRREETQLIDSKTGQKKIGLRYFFSKGKLYYSDKGNWILSTHTSEVGEWGGSVMLAWQQDGENLTLKGISNVIPFHGNYGKISLETVREVSDNSLVIVAKTKAGSDGGGAVQPWVGLWTMPYQMELIYSYVDRISYE